MAKGQEPLDQLMVALIDNEWPIVLAGRAREVALAQGVGENSQEVMDIDRSIRAMGQAEADSAVQYREWQKGPMPSR